MGRFRPTHHAGSEEKQEQWQKRAVPIRRQQWEIAPASPWKKNFTAALGSLSIFQCRQNPSVTKQKS
jgi:hypothetical protein